jgi:hypothetical protein
VWRTTYRISKKEAEKLRVLRTESDRRAFIRKYFHSDIGDPANYDMVLNTGSLSDRFRCGCHMQRGSADRFHVTSEAMVYRFGSCLKNKGRSMIPVMRQNGRADR